MARPIEDQVRESLKKERNDRLAGLVARSAKPSGLRQFNLSEDSIEKFKVRASSESLIQEPEILLRITELDFDLNNKKFVAYAEKRGILHVAGEYGSRRWDFIGNLELSEKDFFEDAFFQESESGHAYTYEDLKIHWEIMRLGRATLQDCWELFTRRTC